MIVHARQRGLVRWVSLAIALTLIGLLGATASRAQTNSPAAGPPGFRATIVGADIVVEGSGNLRMVELSEDGLLWGPGGDMNWPQPNPGPPSTPPGAASANSAVTADAACKLARSLISLLGCERWCHPLRRSADVKL